MKRVAFRKTFNPIVLMLVNPLRHIVGEADIQCPILLIRQNVDKEAALGHFFDGSRLFGRDDGGS
jgi:hypothetical protein